MTALKLNAELYRAMGEIAEDEDLLVKVLKYVKKLSAKKADSSLMSKSEFFDMLDKGEEDFKQGKCTRLQPDETVTDMLRRKGYEL